MELEQPKTSVEDAGSASQSSSHMDSNESGGFKNYIRIFSYADTPGWVLNGLAFTCMITSGIVLPLMDVVLGKFVNKFNSQAVGNLSPSAFQSKLNQTTLWFVYLFIAKFFLTYIWTVCITSSAIRTTKSLRVDFLRQYLRQEIAFFDLPGRSSPSVQVTTNANLVSQGISEKLGYTIQGISTFILAFVVAFILQWKLTLITICIPPVILGVTTICAAIDIKQENKILSIHSQAGTLAEEIFGSIKTAHAFWAFPTLFEKYRVYIDDAKRVGNKKSPNMVAFFSSEYFAVYAGYGLAFWQGVRMYAKGEISQPGDVISVIFAVVVAATALTQTTPQILQLTKAASAATEMFTVIDRRSKIDALDEGGKRPNECFGDIQLADIHFSYPTRPHVPVLQGLNLKIAAKKTTALVGSSGSGKSTVIGLLERWYSPSSGNITIDGTAIDEINIQWLRTNLRTVQQEPVLFNGTVFENVLYGLDGTSQTELPEEEKMRLVVEACKSAYAHEFIEGLPNGYHTQVGERASMLSGGQKQRIAIARSIVSNPKVLLLDEGTSALDPKAEKIVQEALDNVSSTRTTLIIAHKLSTIKKADHIVVMSSGQIVEEGTHSSLIAAEGAYYRLVKAQDLGEMQEDQGNQDVGVSENKVGLAAIKSNIAESGLDRQQTLDTKKNHPGNEKSLLNCLAIFIWETPELRIHFVVLVILCIIGGAVNPALAILFGKTLDVFQASSTPDMVRRGDFFALMFFVLAIIVLFAFGALGWVTNVICQVMTRNYRLELFNNIVRQDMSFFDDRDNTTGALVSRLSTQPTQLQELMGWNLSAVLVAIVNIVGSSILAIAVGWKLGLVVVFAALLPMVLCGYLRIRLEFKLDEQTSQRFSDSAALASEAVASIRTVASLAIERRILENYEQRMDGIARKSLKAVVWTMFWFSITQSINLLSMALSFWYGGRLLNNGEYSTEQLYTVVIGTILSGEAAATLFMFTTSLTKGQQAGNYILWIRSLVPTIREHDKNGGSDEDEGIDTDNNTDDNSEKDSRTNGHIACEKVEFCYPTRPNIPVLRGIDVEIQPGQAVAFVGPSGHGKSSLISLLERYYDPTSGCIRFDGSDISKVCPRQYRRHIALVQQEPTLYQGSLRENIALGLEGAATDEQIEEACRQANIHDFIASLPDGFNTQCGSKGSLLSGGQRQRIAIARALIRKPRLLLLDEATSALDTESEKIVQAAIERAKQGRTIVAVAHRLSTIKNSDRVFVLVRGRIVEAGTHEELIGRRGVYYEMCLGQALDQGT